MTHPSSSPPRVHPHDQTTMTTTPIRTALAAMLMAVLLLSSGTAATATAAAANEAHDADNAATVDSDDSARIDAWVEERMAARDLPGTAVAVVRGGKTVHLAGYGAADEAGRAVTIETPFILGSVSKPFTAVVIGQLVEEGRLSWDEPVWPFLSDLVEKHPKGFETVTVEQLLTHTGGLSMTVGTAGTVTIHEGPDALDRRVEDLMSASLSGEPGESFEYSNAGFMLLAAVVEQVTGRSFATELDDRVFDPLEMAGSFATADDPRAADMATGHQQWFGRWQPTELPYDNAGVAMGYIVSTASDLAKFMQAHLDGHPAIPATAADVASGTVAATGWSTPLDAGYGHGWFVDELAGTPVISHPGSLGHFTAHVVLAPEADGLGIAVLSNASQFLAGHEAQYDIGLGLNQLLLGEQPQAADPSLMTTIIVPVITWAVAILLVAAIGRFLAKLRRHGLPTAKGHGVRRWFRSLWPGAVYLAIGTGLLTAAPLGLARHFYPDGGWAVTVIAYVTAIWGLARLAIGLLALRSRGTDPSRMADHAAPRERSPHSDATTPARQPAEQLQA